MILEYNSIIFLCFVKYEGHPTTTDFSTSGLGNLTTIAGRMNCALSLADCKINRFYPKIPPLSNYEEEWLLLNYYLGTCLSCSFVLTRCCTLTWVTKFWIGPYQMFKRAAASSPLLYMFASLPALVIATARPAQSIRPVRPWPYRFSYSTIGFSFKKRGRKTADRNRKRQKNALLYFANSLRTEIIVHAQGCCGNFINSGTLAGAGTYRQRLPAFYLNL